MPRGLTRYDDNLDESTSVDESSSLSEIDQLNPRSEVIARVRGNERFLDLLGKSSFDSRETTKLPPAQARWNLTDSKNLRNCEITRSDVKSRRDGRTPRIIRAIRHHSERINVKYPTDNLSHREIRGDKSKSSVVVLYDGKSNEDCTNLSTTSFSLSSSSLLSSSKPPPVRVSKSEQTLVTVGLPVLTSSVDKRRDISEKFVVDTTTNAGRSFETPENNNSPCGNFQRRGSTRRRRSEGNGAKQQRRRFTRSKAANFRDTRVTSSWDFERKRRTKIDERCGTHERFSRCLMAHRATCPRQVGERGKTEGDEVERNYEGAKNPRFAFLMQHVQNQQQETGQRGDTKGEFEETTNGDKRVFPFQSTASGNLKIVPNQVVFESKKVSVLVADPHHTRVNVKAELGRGDSGISEAGCVGQVSNENDTNETVIESQGKVKETGYVARTQPFRSSQNIRPGEMEENQVTEAITHRLPLPANEVPLSSLGFTGEQPIDWQNIILPEKTDLYRELARRITNYKNADCIVRLGHDEFHCHLLVLQSYSTYFDEKNHKEVDLTGSSVTSKAFGIIYDWMISPTNESCHLLRRDNILEIFMAAQQLGIKELEEQCWAFIDNDELFTEDTAFLLYLEARKIGNTAVMELMVPRIMKFFLMLVSTRDFLELSVEELCLLLRSNYICVNSEMEVLMSAVRWLMHEWQSRRQHMIQVLKCVRFGLIAPWQLVDVKRNPENPEFMELMSFPEVQKMVDDGLAFVIIKYWYGNQTEDYYHWIDLLGLTEPTNRNWAGEDKNYVTYREFLLYLEEYQRTKMPELKSRKSPESRANHREKDGGTRMANNSSRDKPEVGGVESPLGPMGGIGVGGGGGGGVGGGGGGGGHMGPLLLAASNNLGRSDKFPGRMPGSSSMSGQPPPPLPGAIGMTMPPEILGRYLSSFDRNAKGVSTSRPNETHARDAKTERSGRINGSWRPANN